MRGFFGYLCIKLEEGEVLKKSQDWTNDVRVSYYKVS